MGRPALLGRSASFRQSTEAAGANCATGGVRVDYGVDEDADGTLDAEEIDATAYVCRGEAGADAPALLTDTSTTDAACSTGGTRLRIGFDANANGVLEPEEATEDRSVCQGEDGRAALVVVDDEPPGASCPAGGRRVRSGVDENGDLQLALQEVLSEEVVCDPAKPLVRTTALTSGNTDCANGGTRLDFGLDANGNDVLEAGEINASSFLCNGSETNNTLVRRQTENPGVNCPQGGSRITTGPDLNGNLILDAVEVESTTFVCNGANGAPGSTGSAVRINPEPSGANCPLGGTRIQTGRDANGNGSLEDGEVSGTSYVCDGRATVTLLDVELIAPGTDCPQGGRRILIGRDLDADRVLDASEVSTTTLVCTTVASVPIGFITQSFPTALQNNAFSTTIEAIGGLGGSYEWRLVQGNLPPGLTLSPQGTPSTTISGVPSATGDFMFTVEVKDFFQETATRNFTLSVEELLQITRFELPRLEEGVPYSATLTSAGGTGTKTWSVVGGSLPAGLTLSTTGVISGTPTSADGSTLVVLLTDGAGATSRAGLTIKGEQRYAAICGDFLTDAQDDIVIVPLDGTTVTSTGVRVDGAFEADCFEDHEFSPRKDFFAFLSDDVSPTPGVADLVLVDLRNYPSVQNYVLNPPLDTTEDVNSFLFSPTGDFVAFNADVDGSGIDELFVVDLRTTPPGPATKVNFPVVTGGDVLTTFWWVPGSNKLIYISDELTDVENSIFFYNADTAQPRVQINGALPLNGDVNTSNVVFSPDGRHLAYTSDELVNDQQRLFLVDVSGASASAPLEVSGPFDPEGDVGTGSTDVAFSPNGRWLMFQGDADNLGEKIYAYNVLTGGPPTLVSQDNGNTLLFVTSSLWSPDGRRIAFLGDMVTNDLFELFVADTEVPGSILTISPVLPATSDVNSSPVYQWDPNGRYVVYNVDVPTPNNNEYWLTFLRDAQNPVRLFLNGLAGTASQSIRVSDDGAAVFVTAAETISGEANLHRIAVDGISRQVGQPLRINDDPTTAQNVITTYLLVEGGAGVFFRGDTETDGETDAVIRSVGPGTVGLRQRINPALPSTAFTVSSIRIQKE
ncbi:MAG: hypothetical protein HC923_09100 [Myxococcales bacterium]|nr:hypothetical protein [Myxococcales bacterium]